MDWFSSLMRRLAVPAVPDENTVPMAAPEDGDIGAHLRDERWLWKAQQETASVVPLVERRRAANDAACGAVTQHLARVIPRAAGPYWVDTTPLPGPEDPGAEPDALPHPT